MYGEFNDNDKTIAMAVRCVEGVDTPKEETLVVSPTSKEFTSTGGSFTIDVTSNTSWTAVSDQTWASLDKAGGSGNGSIAVNVAKNTSSVADNANITIKTSTKTEIVIVTRYQGSPIGEKCMASDYPSVKIGNQTWMAENYRCSKYASNSEAYKAGIKSVPVATTDKRSPNAYYVDASDQHNWTEHLHDKNVTSEIAAKFGYLYSWAAVVGVSDCTAQTTAFTGNRQGICPNGWHVPSVSEFHELRDYVEADQHEKKLFVTKYLKSKTGWVDKEYNGSYVDGNGYDTYGFHGYPSGMSSGRSVGSQGGFLWIWSSSTYYSSADQRYYCGFDWYSDDSWCGSLLSAEIGMAVRCVKN